MDARIESGHDDRRIEAPLAIVGSLRLDIDRVERLARGHEQAVSFLAAETEIGAAFRQTDLPDPMPVVGRKHLNAVVTLADPAGADPDIAFGVDPQAVREARSAVQRHVD